MTSKYDIKSISIEDFESDSEVKEQIIKTLRMTEILAKTNWTTEDVCFYANISEDKLRQLIDSRTLTYSNPLGDFNKLYFKKDDVIAELQKKKKISEKSKRNKAVEILVQKMLKKHKMS